MALLDDDIDLDEIINGLDQEIGAVDQQPSEEGQLGAFDIACLFLNRTIGSGIFFHPSRVLYCAGSVGGALMLWTFGGIIHLCGLFIWLEFGLTVPLREIPGQPGKTSVPVSGGEKNYLEFLFGRPEFLAVCMYGIPFIILGNLAGNSIAIGSTIMSTTTDMKDSKGAILGIAVAVLTAAVAVHICSRRGGIVINNIFAVGKVLLLLTLIILGFAIKPTYHNPNYADTVQENLHAPQSFWGFGRAVNRSAVDYAKGFSYVLYSYSGFQQPFYVLSEARSPRKIFPKATITAWAIGTVLFVMLNVSFFYVVPKEEVFSLFQTPNSKAAVPSTLYVFSDYLFGKTNVVARNALAGLAALSIFGNIFVMTFTASRVKQEIAKAGILPYSLWLSRSWRTPVEWLKQKWRPTDSKAATYQDQSPIPALLLHWVSSMLMLAFTAKLEPSAAYIALVDIYAYVIRIMVPLVISGGLLYLKFNPKKDWASVAQFTSITSPFHIILYFITLAFLAITLFVRPSTDSPAYAINELSWIIIPAIGISTLLWGLGWFGGLHLVQRIRHRTLVVKTNPVVVELEGGEWVQKAVIIEHTWPVRIPGEKHHSETDANILSRSTLV